MPAISPTTLLVTGSMSITLSPAAFVWTMRMVAARSATVAGIARMARDASMLAVSLVFIAPHFSRTAARSKLPPVSTAGPSCHPWTSPGCPEPVLPLHIGHREDRHMAQAAWLLLFIVWQAGAPPASTSSLDFDTFKARVQPLLAEKRPGDRKSTRLNSSHITIS